MGGTCKGTRRGGRGCVAVNMVAWLCQIVALQDGVAGQLMCHSAALSLTQRESPTRA